ncbi:MAG: PIN domain-containing protein [Fimbriimonadales bacterium]
MVDADVLIELQRTTPAAMARAKGMGTDSFQVPGIAALELVIGSRDKRERERASRFLDRLRIVWMSEDDHAQAYELAGTYGLSTGLGLADLLIAAQALNRGARLYTFNLKHFGAIRRLNVQAPYER